jgi:PKD repeat protein
MRRYSGYLLAGAVFFTALIVHCSAVGGACPFGGSSGGGGSANPFGDAGGTSDGVVSPFGVDEGGGEPANPFDDTSAGGPADPFPDVSDASGIPCPFGQDMISEGETSMTAVCETVQYPVPGDPDGDGYYEDLNANGLIDFADLILYYNTMDWIRDNQPVNCFDYNGNGNIDFADIIILFREV